MSLYVALTFWLLVIVFTAWGVHTLWGGLVKPRIVNSLLLPGTLVAQLAHVAGLLITGNAVQNTSLMGEGDDGQPQSETPAEQKLPLLASILTGLLPIAACAACLYIAARYLGDGVLGQAAEAGTLSLPRELPTTLAGAWALLHAALSLIEHMLNLVLRSDLLHWKTVLFLYLAICLTVRLAPFAGNRRGALGAILLTGLLVAVFGSFTSSAREVVLSSWAVLSFAAAMLLFLLLTSLLVLGISGLVRVLARNE